MSISITDLWVSYGTNDVLKGVDLKIRSGERFAIMGPSGSGKSSLIRAIAGVIPSTGTIEIDGQDVSDLAPHERPTGLMFQEYALFPHLDVARNIGYGLRMAGMSRAATDARVAELLALVDLEGYGSRDVGSLSGGQQQRVALARTLAPSPTLVLLDEPLGSLDLALRESLLVHMRSVVDDLDITTMYVTHDRSEAFAFADRVAILIDGHIVANDTPEKLWSEPGTVDVARLIGHPNVVDGSAIGLDGWVVIPPSAIRVGPDGDVVGQVVDSVFVDGGYHTTIDAGGTTLRALTAGPVAASTPVRIAIDRDRSIPVEDTSER